MDLPSYIGQRVRAARELSGLTQEQVADALGRSTRTVSNIERGDQATALETLERLAAVLRQPIAYFLEGFEAQGSRGKVGRVRQEARLLALINSLPDRDLALALRLVEAVQERG